MSDTTQSAVVCAACLAALVGLFALMFSSAAVIWIGLGVTVAFGAVFALAMWYHRNQRGE